MRAVRLSRGFERDLKLAQKRGLKLGKLWSVVDLIRHDQALQPRHRPHKLSGDWVGFWECHIAPDWLLIWSYDGEDVVLARTGTHSDLFG